MNKLPTDEFSFVLDYEGEKTKKHYKGNFTFKIPDLGTEFNIEKAVAKNSEGLDLGEEMAALNRVVSYLSLTLIEYPKWWLDAIKLKNHRDYLLYFHIYSKCIDFVNAWDKSIWVEEDEKPEENNKSS